MFYISTISIIFLTFTLCVINSGTVYYEFWMLKWFLCLLIIFDIYTFKYSILNYLMRACKKSIFHLHFFLSIIWYIQHSITINYCPMYKSNNLFCFPHNSLFKPNWISITRMFQHCFMRCWVTCFLDCWASAKDLGGCRG